MRTRAFALILVAAMSACMFQGPAVARAAEWGPARRMAEAVAAVGVAGKKAQGLGDYGYAGGTCFLAAFIGPDAYAPFDLPMEQGEKYLLLGGGEEDADDVDILVLNTRGTVVAKDTDVDANPVVFYEPPRSGKYTIRLKLSRAKHHCFCSLLVMKVGGYTVPIDSVTDAMKNLIAKGERANKAIKDRDADREVVFHDADNQWAIFGSILKPGEQSTIIHLNPGDADMFYVAIADSWGLNIDLAVLDSDGDTIREDTDPDPEPGVIVHTKRGQEYGLKTSCIKTTQRKPTLTLTAVLEIK